MKLNLINRRQLRTNWYGNLVEQLILLDPNEAGIYIKNYILDTYEKICRANKCSTGNKAIIINTT